MATAEFAALLKILKAGSKDGVVELLQVGLNQDPPWLQFEFCDGGELTAVLDDWKPLAKADRVRAVHATMIELARTVSALHRLDVIHRDLKPANILRKRRAGGGYGLAVADFGISKVLPAADARRSTPANSAQQTIRAYTEMYASPQQRRFDLPDKRDDVFALAVIWHQLLRGDVQMPRPGGRRWEKALADLGMKAEAITLMADSWDDDADARPADGADLLDALEKCNPVADAAPPPVALPPVVEVPRPVAPVVASRPPSLDCIALKGRSPEQIAAAVKASQKAWADFLGMPVERRFDLPNGVKLAARLIPPGTFLMGTEQNGAEKPPIPRITITKPFYLGKFPVTQEQYLAVNGTNPAAFSRTGDRKAYVWRLTDDEVCQLPVESVTWDQAKAFCDAGSCRWRLPTEAEWEYACRAGTRSEFPFGNVLDGTQANCDGTNPHGTSMKGPYLRRLSPVGSYPANGFGLFDMIGNVHDWCADWYGHYKDIRADTDRDGGVIDPVQSAKQFWSRRVIRGGSWDFYASNCRAALRNAREHYDTEHNVGFRVCLSLD